MFRVALASVLGNKVRLALTALAIVLGVAFVAGTFTFTDSIDRAFTDLFAAVNEDVDAYVNGVSQVEGTFEQPQLEDPTFDESVADRVEAVDGVAAAYPGLAGFGQVIGPDGEPAGGGGPPTLAFSWDGPDDPGPLTLEEGRAAVGMDEATLDATTVESTGYRIGDTMSVVLADGLHQFEIVGITGFGDETSVGGATIVTFDLPTAQALQGKEGQISQVAVVAEDGVSQEELRGRIADELSGENVEVVTALEQQEADVAEIKEGLSFLNIALLAFAGVALFVGIFLIVNTFSIIVAQRTREFALLRAVGASGAQVRNAVLVEALVVGIVSGVVGLGVGLALGQGLRALLDALGIGFPAGGLVVEPRTVIVSLVLGIVVTAVAAVAPARRASHISPMEALRSEGAGTDERIGTPRTIAGAVASVVGVAALVAGLSDAVPQPAAVTGLGAALSFIGVALLAPHLARPAAAVLGALPARLGLPGRLARNNADGNPKRTASTASALMIGVALVTFVSIFAASATASVNELFAASLGSDFVVQSTNFSGTGVPPGFTADVADADGVGDVTPVRSVLSEVGGDPRTIVGVDAAVVDGLIGLGLDADDPAAASGGLLVWSGSDDPDLPAVGDEVEVTFANGPQTLPVVGIFENNDLLGVDYVTDVSTFDQVGVTGVDQIVLVNAADGVDVEEARASIEAVAENYASLQVQDQTELTDSLRASVDGLLNIMIGLLGLALVIALIGIVNTLALSVFERTREIGLLRAVGMTRRQVRSMVRWESVIVSVFGAVLGVGVGAVFGWALVMASADSGLGVLEFPATRLVVYVVVAGIAGVLAAVFPARRAARLDVLDAVTSE